MTLAGATALPGRARAFDSYNSCRNDCMAIVRTAHTADLDDATLGAARALLDEVFAGDMSDEDWEHALGGFTLWSGRTASSSATHRWFSAGCFMAAAHCAPATSKESACAPIGAGAGTAAR